jgi:hypothetical protein
VLIVVSGGNLMSTRKEYVKVVDVAMVYLGDDIPGAPGRDSRLSYLSHVRPNFGKLPVACPWLGVAGIASLSALYVLLINLLFVPSI